MRGIVNNCQQSSFRTFSRCHLKVWKISLSHNIVCKKSFQSAVVEKNNKYIKLFTITADKICHMCVHLVNKCVIVLMVEILRHSGLKSE